MKEYVLVVLLFFLKGSLASVATAITSWVSQVGIQCGPILPSFAYIYKNVVSCQFECGELYMNILTPENSNEINPVV